MTDCMFQEDTSSSSRFQKTWRTRCGSAGSGVSAGLGEEVEAEGGEEEPAEGSGVGAGLGEEVEVAEQSEAAEQHSTSGVPVA